MSKTQNTSSTDNDDLNMLSKHNLSEFLTTLKTWTQKIRAGELSARMPVSSLAEIMELSQDIRTLCR